MDVLSCYEAETRRKSDAVRVFELREDAGIRKDGVSASDRSLRKGSGEMSKATVAT